MPAGPTRFPHGVSSYGVPILPNVDGGRATGDVWFVDSGAGSNDNSGKAPDQAFATIDKAFDTGLVTANNGDIIYVLEGHNESLTAATSLVIDKAGTRIVGLGVGRNRPILDMDNTAATIEMDAANCTLENIVIRGSVSAQTVGINVDANDCTIKDCEFTYEATGNDIKSCIDLNAVSRTQIIGCVFDSEPSKVGTEKAIVLNDSDGTVVLGCHFKGAYKQSIVYSSGTASVDIYIANNVGRNDEATAGRNIQLTVDDTGLIEHNRFVTAYGSAVSGTMDPGACGCVENYISHESAGGLGNDFSGVRIPFGEGASDWQVSYCDATAFAGGTTNKRGDDGGSNDPFAIAKVHGIVECYLLAVCGTTIAGASSELSVGVTGATGALLAKVTGTDIEVGQVGGGNALLGTTICLTGPANILNNVTINEWVYAANVTGGNLDYIIKWRPLKPGSHVETIGTG